MTKYTLDDIWTACRESRVAEKRRANTLEIDRKGYIALASMMEGLKSVSELTIQHLAKHIARRVEEGKSHRTINIEVGAAQQVLKWAVEWEMCKSTPRLKRVLKRKPLEKRRVRKYRALNLAEVHSLLLHIPEQWRLLFQVYLCTGMRRGEALDLPWAEVDPEEAVINLGAERTKTRAGRVVLLGPRIVSMLAALPRSSDYVFANPQTGKPYDVSMPGRVMQKTARDAGWLKREYLSPHTLRRSFATIAWEAGADKTTVGELLGHKGTLAEESYIQVPLDTLRAEAAKVEALVLGGEEE